MACGSAPGLLLGAWGWLRWAGAWHVRWGREQLGRQGGLWHMWWGREQQGRQVPPRCPLHFSPLPCPSLDLLPPRGPLSSIISFLSQIVSLWANLLGGVFPLLSARLGFNPAVTSAPLMTTGGWQLSRMRASRGTRRGGGEGEAPAAVTVGRAVHAVESLMRDG